MQRLKYALCAAAAVVVTAVPIALLSVRSAHAGRQNYATSVFVTNGTRQPVPVLVTNPSPGAANTGLPGTPYQVTLDNKLSFSTEDYKDEIVHSTSPTITVPAGKIFVIRSVSLFGHSLQLYLSRLTVDARLNGQTTTHALSLLGGSPYLPDTISNINGQSATLSDFQYCINSPTLIYAEGDLTFHGEAMLQGFKPPSGLQAVLASHLVITLVGELYPQ